MSWVGKSFHSKLSLDKWKFGLYKGAAQYSTNIFNFLCVFSESSQQIHSKLRYWVFTTIGDEKNTFLEISKVFTNKFPANCPSGHRWWPGGCLSKDIQKLQISSKLSGEWSRFWFAIYRMSASLQWEHFSTTLCWPWGVSSDESTNTARGHCLQLYFPKIYLFANHKASTPLDHPGEDVGHPLGLLLGLALPPAPAHLQVERHLDVVHNPTSLTSWRVKALLIVKVTTIEILGWEPQNTSSPPGMSAEEVIVQSGQKESYQMKKKTRLGVRHPRVRDKCSVKYIFQEHHISVKDVVSPGKIAFHLETRGFWQFKESAIRLNQIMTILKSVINSGLYWQCQFDTNYAHDF